MITICIEGGLGDQVDAEPTIRYARDVVYKDTPITLMTRYPELFTHLNIPFVSQPPIGSHVLHTHGSPESRKVMTHAFMHGVDFVSIRALKLMLPFDQKTIHLEVKSEATEKVSALIPSPDKTILMHPGLGWPSKTFPISVWQSYVDVLTNAGYTVAIIGKTISAQHSVLTLDTKQCIDLSNKLSLSELIAAISLCPILISNDSAPIHIAGAFNNWIGVIPTCKRPDHILPYRCGSPFYKAVAIEADKRLYDTWNRKPCQVQRQEIINCSEAELVSCLPTPTQILEFAQSILIN